MLPPRRVVIMDGIAAITRTSAGTKQPLPRSRTPILRRRQRLSKYRSLPTELSNNLTGSRISWRGQLNTLGRHDGPRGSSGIHVASTCSQYMYLDVDVEEERRKTREERRESEVVPAFSRFSRDLSSSVINVLARGCLQKKVCWYRPRWPE